MPRAREDAGARVSSANECVCSTFTDQSRAHINGGVRLRVDGFSRGLIHGYPLVTVLNREIACIIPGTSQYRIDLVFLTNEQ